MVGPFPLSPRSIDGGAASALMYLCSQLVRDPDIELVGVRMCDSATVPCDDQSFDWPMHNIAVRRLGLIRLYGSEIADLQNLISEVGADVVHAQGIDLPGFISVRCGIPALVTVHGIPEKETAFVPKIFGRLREHLACRLISHRTLSQARNIVSINPYVDRFYAKRLQGQVFQISNAVSQEYFTVNRRPEGGRVLYAGRLIRRKGILDLIKAFSFVEGVECRLILAGACPDSRYLGQIKAQVEQLGLRDRVIVCGHLTESQMLKEFALAEVLVLPSYQETAPMVIQQAMAAGIPVIASRICGIPYQLRDGVDGLLFSPGDLAELSNRLKTILSDAALARVLGENSRERALLHFQSSSVARATITAYRSLRP